MAPTLGNYRHGLLIIKHGLESYPLELIHEENTQTINNPEELLQAIRVIFNDDSTKRKIETLMTLSDEGGNNHYAMAG